MMSTVSDPSMVSCANLMPSTRLSFWLMSMAVSSVEFTAPEPMAMNCTPSPLKRSTSSSALPMQPTVAMAKVPKRERTMSGWGSESLMQPMADFPWKSARSFSNRVRKGVFSME